MVRKAPVSMRRMSVERHVDFFGLAASVPIPANLAAASWPEVRRLARERRAQDAGVDHVLSFDRSDAKLKRNTSVRREEP